MNPLVIAEGGVCHNGDLGRALEMVAAASECGADVIKFQIFKSEKLAARSAKLAPYQQKNSLNALNQYEMLKALELDQSAFEKLKDYSESLGIEFLLTPFDRQSSSWIRDLKMYRVKIGSGDLTDYLLLGHVAEYATEIFLSTGMASYEEIAGAIEFIRLQNSKVKVYPIYCVSSYPTRVEDLDLLVIKKFIDIYKTSVGFSDHTLGTNAATAALALGATIFEKHFTLDKNLPGPDHSMSLGVDELKLYVESIRAMHMALQQKAAKSLTSSEIINAELVRKSLVAGRLIKKGEKFSLENLEARRPGDGVSPSRLTEILGVVANKDYEDGEQILL